jgi:CheY-like chemotaxis protein
MKRILACLTCGSMLERSEQERGLCGRCYIPKKGEEPGPVSVSTGASRSAPKADAPPAGPAARKKILLIDDEPIIVKLLSKRLEASGYLVITAADGEEGYRLIKSLHPDLVLSDLLMPKLTGYDLVQKLAKEKDGTQNIPVLIMTAKPSMKSFFDNWEIHGFIAKPVVPEELLKKIADLMEVAELMKRKKK